MCMVPSTRMISNNDFDFICKQKWSSTEGKKKSLPNQICSGATYELKGEISGDWLLIFFFLFQKHCIIHLTPLLILFKVFP